MKKKIFSVVMCTLLSVSSLIPAVSVKAEDAAPSTIAAFPGAEGGGMYTSGGRGCEVYEVTNLNDSGPGSLRDAISQDNRTIVFRVSGTINLTSGSLKFSGRKNITIAGQTAPGDGICITGDSVDVGGSYNIIIRYLRVRPGSATNAIIEKEPDGLGGVGASYIMLDHMSTSWSTDETLSLYDNSNLTLQWSIASESLTVSGHSKGKHGYGGIWGGSNATFHHNLIIHHTSRLPRFAGSNDLTYANNVVYNWEFNNSYGGSGLLRTNMVNNYYKAGPSTVDKVKARLANPGEGQWYISGNILEGNDAVNADNSKGLQDISPSAVFKDKPFINDAYTTVNITDAKTAYKDVLSKVGATFPRRDANDARLIQDVKDGTGRTINREYEVGGLSEYKLADAPVDTDHDGMPDAWETAKGLNPNDKEDGKAITTGGYSNLELYLNSLVDMSYTPDNPVVKLITPTYNSLFTEGNQIRIDAEATDKDGIEKVEFYLTDVNLTLDPKDCKPQPSTITKAGEALTAPYSVTLPNVKAGNYFISARAYDKQGNATQTTSMPIYVNGAEVTGEWKSVDIGNAPLKGSGSLDASGTLTVKGSGKITGKSDSFHYVYQPISGNATLLARLDYNALIDNDTISGLMIRDSLDSDAAMALISTSIIKAGRDENANGFGDDTYFGTFFSSRMKKGETAKAVDWGEPQDYLPSLVDHKLPIWLKIERVDNEIITYTSTDNVNWKELSRNTFSMGKEAYIGFAVDATQAEKQDIYYNTAKFSNIQLTNSFTVTEVKLADIFGNPVDSLTPGANVVANITVSKNSLAIANGTIAIQICDANDRVISTSYVKSNFSTGSIKNVKAGFSTPMNLQGVKVKAYVINNVKDKIIISNVSVK